jgi:hypothetical protein
MFAPWRGRGWRSLAHAQTFCDAFFWHYNHIRRHSALGLHTPADVHPGRRPPRPRSRDQFRCAACGHEHHADLNAAENIATRGQACEAAWRTAGSPSLPRPKPRLRRHKAATEPATAQAA